MDALWSITNSRTVPQVFIKGEFIGGCDGETFLQIVCKVDMLLKVTMQCHLHGAHYVLAYLRNWECRYSGSL